MERCHRGWTLTQSRTPGLGEAAVRVPISISIGGSTKSDLSNYLTLLYLFLAGEW